MNPSTVLSPVTRAPAASAQTLMREHTAGSLFAAIGFVFRHHYGVLLLCGVLPFVVLLVLVVIPGLSLVGPFLSTAVLTVALSDLFLGNRPKIGGAYAHVLRRGRWWKGLTTNVLVSLATLAMLLLLVVPGVWFIGRSIFTPIVVVLEGRSNRDAIRRSFELTQGQFWRIAGLVTLVSGAFLLAALLLIGALALSNNDVLIGIGVVTGILLFTPVFGLVLVLLYYDQRVRREGYDAHALSEDMMR